MKSKGFLQEGEPAAQAAGFCALPGGWRSRFPKQRICQRCASITERDSYESSAGRSNSITRGVYGG
jgi:hypothetical protein